jgi:hypothetical protein
MRPFLILSAIALATQAQATLSPCATDDLMAEAVMVVQVVDQEVRPLGNNICRFSGTIVATHRGLAEVGRNLTADFNCPLDASQIAIGASWYYNPDDIRAAGALEVHINAEGFIAAFGAGLIALNAPTQSMAWEPFCN